MQIADSLFVWSHYQKSDLVLEIVTYFLTKPYP